MKCIFIKISNGKRHLTRNCLTPGPYTILKAILWFRFRLQVPFTGSSFVFSITNFITDLILICTSINIFSHVLLSFTSMFQ